MLVLLGVVAWAIVQLRRSLVEAYGPSGALGAIALALPALIVVLFPLVLLDALPWSGLGPDNGWQTYLPYVFAGWVAVVLAAAAAVTLLRHRAAASSEPATS